MSGAMAAPGGARRRGRVFRVGDDVNTDLLFPGRYTYTRQRPEEAAPHALEDLDPSFSTAVRPGDVVVAGRNFGCGSSREQAVTALAALGVGAVVAESFARIYFRNALNHGLPAIVCPEAVVRLEAGDPVELDLEEGWIETPRGRCSFPPFEGRMAELLEAGGLLPYVRRRLTAEGSP